MKREGVNENSRGGKGVALPDSMSNEQVCISVYVYLFIWLCWVFVEISWPGIKLGPLALGARRLSHWATRGVPVLFFVFLRRMTYW